MSGSAPLSATSPARESSLDLAEMWRAVRAGWTFVVLWIVVGLALGAAVLLFWPRSFEGRASVLVRSASDGGSGILSRIGVPTEVTSGLLGSAIKSPLETELQLLQSRTLLSRVADSLGLQVRVLAPEGTPSWRVVIPAGHEGAFKKRRYTFTRRSDGAYDVSGPDAKLTAKPGTAVVLPVATITLRDSLPADFRLEILDHEDLLKRAIKRLAIQKAGGEIAAIVYQDADSLTAAAVPNALVAMYLTQRRTVDRGVNQRRYEFLGAQVDSLDRQLASAQRDLRSQQEHSGVLDPEISGKALIEADFKLRENLETVVVEQVALEHLLAQVTSGTMNPRQLAAYPSFLKSPGINELLAQIGKLEAERASYSQLRTEAEPSVVARTEGIKVIEAQLTPLAKSYATSLVKQRAELERMRDSLDGVLRTLPATAEGWASYTRDVKRLTQTALMVQGQRVEARLAAIGEGGEARQVDIAEPAKKPTFPTPAIALGVGGAVGLVLGILAALISAFVGRYIRTPDDAERAAGIAATWAVPQRALLIGGASDGIAIERVLVAPLGRGADAAGVARLLTETESRRESGLPVTVVGSLDSVEAATQLSATRLVLFAARAGSLERRSLVRAVAALRRAGVPCAGVALHHELG